MAYFVIDSARVVEIKSRHVIEADSMEEAKKVFYSNDKDDEPKIALVSYEMSKPIEDQGILNAEETEEEGIISVLKHRLDFTITVNTAVQRKGVTEDLKPLEYLPVEITESAVRKLIDEGVLIPVVLEDLKNGEEVIVCGYNNKAWGLALTADLSIPGFVQLWGPDRLYCACPDPNDEGILEGFVKRRPLTDEEKKRKEQYKGN